MKGCHLEGSAHPGKQIGSYKCCVHVYSIAENIVINPFILTKRCHSYEKILLPLSFSHEESLLSRMMDDIFL